MQDQYFLLILLMLGFALATVAMAYILRFPTVLAYVTVGIIFGPAGLALINEHHAHGLIAELGLIFLIFSIGLEVSFPALNSVLSSILRIGAFQILSCVTVFGLLAYVVFDFDIVQSLLIGAIFAISSTAIVSSFLLKEGALQHFFGRRTIGLLLLQDLAVIPVLSIVSQPFGVIESQPYGMFGYVGLLLIKLLLIIAVLLYVGPKVLSKWFNWVIKWRSNELFVLNVMFIVAATSGFTIALTNSPVLGAFISGIIIAETLHRYRVITIIEPWREIFLGFFFVALGAQIDASFLFDNLLSIMALAVAVITIKTTLLYASTRLAKIHHRDSVEIAFILGGGGEFSLVLLTLAGSQFFGKEPYQYILAITVICTLLTPVLWQLRKIKMPFRKAKQEYATASKNNLQAANNNLQGHVVVCGYGRSGKKVVDLLAYMQVPYRIIESNYSLFVSDLGDEHMLYGDASQISLLHTANVARAAAVVISFSDVREVSAIVTSVREISPEIEIVACADFKHDAMHLAKQHVHDIVMIKNEAAYSMATLALAKTKYSKRAQHVLLDYINKLRKQASISGKQQLEPIESELQDFHNHAQQLHSFVVEEDWDCIGKPLPDALRLGSLGSLISWRRDGQSVDFKQADIVLAPKDEILLLVSLDKVEKIVEMLSFAKNKEQ